MSWIFHNHHTYRCNNSCTHVMSGIKINIENVVKTRD